MPLFAALSVVPALLIATAGPAHAFNWHTHIVDVGKSVGLNSSIAIDSNGHAHISYLDAAAMTLKYATNASGAWVSTVVDSSTETGFVNSIAVDPWDGLHVSYRDRNGDVKYAGKPAGAPGWQIEVVDVAVPLVFIGADLYGSTWTSSIALYPFADPREGWRPYICFPQHVDKGPVSHAKVAYKSGGVWHVDTVDATSSNAGKYCAIAFDTNAHAHVVYRNVPDEGVSGMLKRGIANNGQAPYFLQVIDNDDNAWPSAISLAVGPTGTLYVTYAKWEMLWYATDSLGPWALKVLAPNGDPMRTSIKVGSNGIKQIAYDVNEAPMSLAYMAFVPDLPKDADIYLQTVDDEGEYHYCSLALDKTDLPHISHYSVMAKDHVPTALKYSHTYLWFPW